MRATTLWNIATLFTAALAQTPAGTLPTTDVNLGAEYDSTMVTPNILLPRSLVATQPTVYSNTTYPSTYQLLLIDQSIPYSRLPANTSFSTLVPGLGTNRTTRLHWWATNITQSASGTLTNSSSALAEYGGPSPPFGDIPHYYVLYLFSQPENFAINVSAAQRLYNPASVATRMNFSIEGLAAAVGEPVAATWFGAVNPDVTNVNGTANGTSNGTTVGASATPSPSPYTGGAAKALQGVGVGLAFLGTLAFAFF